MISKTNFDSHIPNFITFLSDRNNQVDYLEYEIQSAWTKHWNLEDINLAETYERSLKSQISNRLWRSSDHEPKAMMIHLMEFEREFARMIFRDLFDESKAVDLRMQRFIYHCDQIFEDFKKVNKLTKVRSHYHDNSMVSLYLFLQNPGKYLYLENNLMQSALIKLGAKNQASLSLESQHKMGTIIAKFLNDNEVITPIITKNLKDRGIPYKKNNAITCLFVKWLCQSKVS